MSNLRRRTFDGKKPLKNIITAKFYADAVGQKTKLCSPGYFDNSLIGITVNDVSIPITDITGENVVSGINNVVYYIDPDKPLTSLESLFSNCELVEIDFSELDVSKVTSVRDVFSGCKVLETVIFDNCEFDSPLTFRQIYSNVMSDEYFNTSTYESSIKFYMRNAKFKDVVEINSPFWGHEWLDEADFSGTDFSGINDATSTIDFFSSDCPAKIKMDNCNFSNIKSTFGAPFNLPNNGIFYFRNCDFRGLETPSPLIRVGYRDSLIHDMYIYLDGCRFDNLTKFAGLFLLDAGQCLHLHLNNLSIPENCDMSDLFQHDTLQSVSFVGTDMTKVTNMDRMFDGVYALEDVYISGPLNENLNFSSKINSTYDSFTIHYDTESTAEKLKQYAPECNFVKTFNPTECISISITADDVLAIDTNTTIHVTAVCNGTGLSDLPVYNQVVTFDVQSDAFSKNTSSTSTVQREISYTYLGKTTTTTITQDVYGKGRYTIDLNDQWELRSDITNPDNTLYDGVYASINPGDEWLSRMYINIDGYTNFKLYIRSYAESNYDYVLVSQLDQTIYYDTSYNDTNIIKAHTRGNQQGGKLLSNYTLVEFTNIDGGPHTITVAYRKDASESDGYDEGYLIIPKN